MVWIFLQGMPKDSFERQRTSAKGRHVKRNYTGTKEVSGVPTYITLFRFTPKGAQEIRGGPGRLDAAKQAAKAAGGELKAFYLTFGRYDGVVISEAPNDEAAASRVLQTGSQGYLQTETLRAFTESEYRKIIAALPKA